MSPEAISPLRQRMIEDMSIRQFGEKTRRDYIRQVREVTAFLGRSPDRAEPEDLRRYQLHLAALGASYARMNLAGTALRFFFHVTLGRPGFGDRMARIAATERLPVVLSHVLPDGFPRIRHDGLFASGTRAANIARIRSLLAPAPPSEQAVPQPAHNEPAAPA